MPRGATLGAISFVFADGQHPPSDVDVALAEDLAGRAALAIDNAKLLREARTARNVTVMAMEAAEGLTTEMVVQLLPVPVLEGLAAEAETRGEDDVAGILEAVAVVATEG